MTKNRNDSGFAHLAIITIVLAVAVIGLLGYVFWQNFMQPKVTSNSRSSTNSASSSSSPVDPYSSWKTYSNSTYNFSIRYPSDWVVENLSSPDIINITSPNITETQKGVMNAPQHDIWISRDDVTNVVTDNTRVGISALKTKLSGGDTSSYYTSTYTETINSMTVSEFDILANPAYFSAVTRIGSYYIGVDFLTAVNKSAMTSDMNKILSSLRSL